MGWANGVQFLDVAEIYLWGTASNPVSCSRGERWGHGGDNSFPSTAGINDTLNSRTIPQHYFMAW